VQTLCRGSWPFGDLTATRANVPLGERCLACWRRAAGCDAFEGALIEAWLDLETEDRDREQLHEAVRDELMREWSEPDRGTVISGETLAIARTVTAERSDPYETVIVDPEGERR
jgi:hypothetical protein